jgi:hypothetical protein
MWLLTWFLMGLSGVACANQVLALEVPNAVAMTTVREWLNVPNLVSANGRDFEIIRPIGSSTVRPGHEIVDRFLIQGGLHGNEVATTEFVRWLGRRYARGESILNNFPVGEVEIDFLPSANPDGGAAGDRYNAQGVNLNRNFGVLWGISRENPGQRQFSEPETRAIKHLFEVRRYLAAVDVHGFIDWVVSPSSVEELRGLGGEGHKDPKRREIYRQWYRHLEDEVTMMPSYSLKTAASLGDGGAFEDWAFWSMGTLSFCLEMESFKRFASSGQLSVMEMTPQGDVVSIDLFKRYELFIYRMFQHARTLREASQQVAAAAIENPRKDLNFRK